MRVGLVQDAQPRLNPPRQDVITEQLRLHRALEALMLELKLELQVPEEGETNLEMQIPNEGAVPQHEVDSLQLQLEFEVHPNIPSLQDPSLLP